MMSTCFGRCRMAQVNNVTILELELTRGNPQSIDIADPQLLFSTGELEVTIDQSWRKLKSGDGSASKSEDHINMHREVTITRSRYNQSESFLTRDIGHTLVSHPKVSQIRDQLEQSLTVAT